MAQMLEILTPAEVAGFLPEEARQIEREQARVDQPLITPEPIWGVIVDCVDEDEQMLLLESMIAEGRDCRALMT